MEALQILDASLREQDEDVSCANRSASHSAPSISHYNNVRMKCVLAVCESKTCHP